ncbi:MAG: type IV toxin-antitoxin system AbiEi family antitoxin domain-containing protein [Mycobacteriales bacterium]|nr:type IV toxin-antitoxin system AbiEi family antitoxin domain-containing protein [Mycobacteriales bacterium]
MDTASDNIGDAVAALRLLAARQQGVFTWGQALALGIPLGVAATTLRRGDWYRLRRGVYAFAEEVWERAGDDWAMHHLRCAAEVLALGFDPVVSHEWAARLHRMHHLGSLSPRPVISRQRHRDDERSERKGLYVVQLPEPHRTTVAGVGATTPARTAVDLARRDGLLAGVVAADAALWAGASPEELDAVARHCWHWPGGATGRAAVVLAREGAQSALESIGRRALVEREAPEPELQVEVLRWGQLLGVADMAWRGLLLVAEADGAVKYERPWAPRPLLTEKRRQEDFEQCGLAVLRYDWDESWSRPGELYARWRAKAATAASRRLAAGVELRPRGTRRAA